MKLGEFDSSYMGVVRVRSKFQLEKCDQLDGRGQSQRMGVARNI